MADFGYFDEGLNEWSELLNKGNELVFKLDKSLDDLVGSKEARSEILIEGDDSIHHDPMLINIVADQFVHVEIEES